MARFPGLQPGIGKPDKHARGKAKAAAKKGPKADSKGGRRIITEEYTSQNQLADFVVPRC